MIKPLHFAFFIYQVSFGAEATTKLETRKTLTEPSLGGVQC